MAQDAPRLYVGNLPYVAQRQDIEALFANNDVQIKKIDMAIDPFTGRNPSYCFVDFHDLNTAQHVLDSMQGQNVRGRPIKINLTTERKTHENRNRLPTKTYDQGWKPKEVAVQDVDPETAYAFDRWNRDDAHAHWTAPAKERRRLYVGGLPRIPNQDSLNVEMRQLFKEYPVQAVSKLISPHHTERSQQGSLYFCYIDLENPIDAKNAVTMLDGTKTPYGGAYKIRLTHPERGTGIVRREQLSSTSKVYVGGLPEIQTQDELEIEIRRLFEGLQIRHVGKLIVPNPPKEYKEKQGNYHYCFVEFVSAKDAQTAVESMDGKQLPSGAVYKIRFAREHNRNGLDDHTGPSRSYQQNRDQKPINRNLEGSWRRSD